MIQISCLPPDCILELLRNCNVVELVTLHCTVNESSPWFTTHTTARWSFLKSLRIPVNSQALSLGNVQWLSHFLEHPSPQIMRPSPQSLTTTWNCVAFWVSMVLVRESLVRCPLYDFRKHPDIMIMRTNYVPWLIASFWAKQISPRVTNTVHLVATKVGDYSWSG